MKDSIDFIELAYWVKYPGLSACSSGWLVGGTP